jgi:hypothetical protein
MSVSLIRRATALAIVVVLALPAVAAAAVIDHFRESFAFDASTEFCGVAVDAHFEGFNTTVIRDDGRDLTTVLRKFTWTNPENGRVVTFFGAGQASRGLAVTDNGDGTITIVYAVTGTQRFQSGHRTLLSATGQIVFADTIDLHDPADPDDDELIATEILSVAGPHLTVDVCEVVGPALD